MTFQNPKTGIAAGLPPIRACLFDMDGLLIDSEDLYTLCTNEMLHEYGKPDLPWSIKAQLQGRPGPEAGRIFHAWAQLPITNDEFMTKQSALQRKHFPSTQPLPGVPTLLSTLQQTLTSNPPGQRVHIALATSSHAGNFALKTAHLPHVFDAFPAHARVLGDDGRIPKGRGKPCPDIYLLALEMVNGEIRRRKEEARAAGGDGGNTETETGTGTEKGPDSRVDEAMYADEPEIRPDECLVFEDSVPGVEAGRRAGMQVVWCPHPGLRAEYVGQEAAVLAGRSGMAGGGPEEKTEKVGQEGDGWARLFPTLEDFPYADYGIRT